VPELPEVEVVRRGLDAHAVGSVIAAVEVLHDRPVRRHPDGASGFVTALTGRRIEAARRRGKYLWLPLDNGDALLGHLGMSGQMLVQPVGAPDERHLRVRFLLDPSLVDTDGLTTSDGSARSVSTSDGSAESVSTSDGSARELRFVDQRMFGGLSVSPGGAELPAEIAHIARDLLDPEFDLDDFVRRVRRRTSGVKRLLLDQTLVSGVGNIYADEALWRARIHGDRAGDRLTARQVRELAAHATDVMAEALGQGGTSFDALYVNVSGQSGYFERSLNAYGREDQPCRRCGTAMRRIAFMNRSSYFCPNCQKAPRTRR
jgi:formamidopyrimidine-DNA glycosylase